MPSATEDLIVGFAAHLAAAGTGLTWRPTGAYTAGETGLYMRALPPDGRAVALSAYSAVDHPSLAVGSISMQALCRGEAADPSDVDGIADAIFGAVHSAEDLWFGGLHVIQILRASSALLGRDGNDRWTRADNYRADVDYPPTANRDN